MPPKLIDRPVLFSILPDMDFRKTLYILFELGETVIPHFEISESVADLIAEGTKRDTLAARIFNKLDRVFLQHLFFALVFIEGD